MEEWVWCPHCRGKQFRRTPTNKKVGCTACHGIGKMDSSGAMYGTRGRGRFQPGTFDLPFNWKVVGLKVQTSPEHVGKFQHAIDFLMPEGSEVFAPADGLVTEVQNGGEHSSFVTIQHGLHANKEWSQLVNFKSMGILVSPRQNVKAGQRIGYSGGSGLPTEPHLHFVILQIFDRAVPQSKEIRWNPKVEAMLRIAV